MPFIIGAAIVGGAAIAGGSSMMAANKQSKAAKEAAAMQWQQYGQTRSDLMPWQKAGGISLAELMRLEGLGTPSGEDFGFLRRPFTGADLEREPGYQFGLQEGEKAIQRRASAMGSRLSPATLKALTRFNQDYAGTKFGEAYSRDRAFKGDQFNQLFGISTAGQNAATQTGYAGMTSAGRAGEATMGAGNAQAAGIVGAGNAITGGLSNAVNVWQQRQLLDRYLSYGNEPWTNYPTGTSNVGWQGTGSTFGYD